jgi:hypothetical protein
VQAGGQTRTIAGNTTFQGNANYIEFYNRQRGINSTSLVSLLDNVVVTGNPQTDLIASSLAWNDAQAGVDFGYEVKSARLPEPTNVALVWSQDTHFNLTGPDADTIAYITPAHEAIDTYAVSVAASMLAAPPPEAKYLLLVVDPYEKVQESDETNNVRYIPLVRKPDLEAVEVGINEFGIYYYYKVENEPLPAATSAHLYWGDHEDFRHANLTEAAAPNDIPSGQEPGTYSDGVYKANMRPAPLGTTHLFLVLDPDGTIDEARDGNNVSYVSMLIAPSVEVYFTDPRGNAVNQVYKGYDYKIWAKVMNNDVDDPINVRLRWDEIFTTIPYPHDPVSGGTLELTLPPSDEQSVELGTIRHYWDWIPEKAPGKAEQDIALGMMISLIDNFNTVVSEGTPPGYSDVLALAQTLISVLEAKLFAYPETTLTYRVSAEWASQRSVQAEKPLLLTVPQERRKWLADYVALNGLANYYTSYAIPLLIYFDPSNWMGYLLNEVTAFHDWVAQRPQCLNQPRISDGHTARNATPSAS